DLESWTAVSARHVEIARTSGALVPLCFALTGYATALARAGDLDGALARTAEERALKEVTGTQIPSLGGLTLRAYRGTAADLARLTTPEAQVAARSGIGHWSRVIMWATAVLLNARRNYAEVVDLAAPAVRRAGSVFTEWVLPELVEAAARTGRTDLAREAAE